MRAAVMASLADETPEGRSIVELGRNAGVTGDMPFGAKTTMSTFFPKADTEEDKLTAVFGLPTAPFLVCDCYNFCHAHFFLPGNFGCSTWNIRSCARSFPVARTSQLVV